MSRSERGKRWDILSNIDAVLNGDQKSVAEISEVSFRPVSASEIKILTDDIRSHPLKGNLVEKLNHLKQSALAMVLVGEKGKLVRKGSEYFPGSKALVVRAHEVKRLDNDLETIDYRNDVLSHVLSTDSNTLSDNQKKEVKVFQEHFASIKKAFGQLPGVQS